MLPPPPLSPYGTLSGHLFQYSSNLVAFESPPIAELPPTQPSPNKCVLLGGLSDGLLPTPYTESLQHALGATNSDGWSLVQPLLSSSYTGFGHGRLSRDVEELDQLLAYLFTHRQAERVALIGHSTGCQDIVHYLKVGYYAKRICCAVLQAPVSDREQVAVENPESYRTHLERARELQQQGQAEEMMPRSAFWAPITAQRLLDLHERGGMDDFFSSDYTNEELSQRLGHIGDLHETLKGCLVAYSGADEYVPSHIKTRALMDRLVQAMNTPTRQSSQTEVVDVARGLYLPTGNHNLSKGANDAKTFVECVAVSK